MTTLDSAWRWYQSVRRHAKLTDRLASRHWQDLGWDGPLGRDDFFKELTPENLVPEAASVLAELDDLAVLVLFSVFEAIVREVVKAEVQPEATKLTSPALKHAAKEALQAIEEGSFFRVLEPYKTDDLAGLIEQVNQVRRYRNWVAHGRRGTQPVGVTPRTAYDRLSAFLRHLAPAPPSDVES